MPLITLGVFLLHGSRGRGSLPFSHSSVIGNLVTVLNFKFWHLYGTAIHLLARCTARGFLRNPLIVLNTNNIYIHWDETKFTAGFWGWLWDSNPEFPACSPASQNPRVLLRPGGLLSLEQSLIYRVCPPANKSPLLSPPLPITPHSYSPPVVDMCHAIWIPYHKGTPWFVIPFRGIVLLKNKQDFT